MSCKHRYVYLYECECIYDVLLTSSNELMAAVAVALLLVPCLAV